jgi:hypothetical protein
MCTVDTDYILRYVCCALSHWATVAVAVASIVPRFNLSLVTPLFGSIYSLPENET